MLEIIPDFALTTKCFCVSVVMDSGELRANVTPKATVWPFLGLRLNLSNRAVEGRNGISQGLQNQMERSVKDSGRLPLDRIEGSALYPALSSAGGQLAVGVASVAE